jgi:NAD(P)H-hydrate epimerase
LTGFPEITRAGVPELTTAQMIEADRAMIEDYGIALIQMMENAGRALAILARDRFLEGAPEGKRITVLAGRGGNGGGALVAARRLATWGCDVRVAVSREPDSFGGIPARQLAILRAMEIPLATALPEAGSSDVVLDGLIGYSLAGAPRGMAASLIRWASNQTAPLLALDVPSGLDASTGTAFDPSIAASATLTLALPKAGLHHRQVGELYLGDISVPPGLFKRYLGLDLGPVFASGDILRLV